MKKVLIAVFVLSVMMSALAHAGPTALVNQTTYNGHTYYLTDAGSSWTEAEAFAVTKGGHLVTINDASENAFLYSTYVAPPGAAMTDHWIGLYSPTGVLANWVWVSGDTASYRNWRGGQPDAGYNQDYYAVIGFGGAEWDNYPDTGFRLPTAIVEITSSVPEPATMLLFGLGLAGLAGVRRFNKQ